MNRRSALPLFSALVSCAILLSSCSFGRSGLKVGRAADGEVVEAEGLAAMTDDLLSVKRAALEDARKNAVEKVVGVLISARSVVDKAILIDQKILSKTDGYVKNYTVLKEGKGSDGIYHTRIRALVSFKEVKDDLMAADLLSQPKVGNPRVAILLQETVAGSNDAVTACSDAIAQGLLEKGYKVVDRSELAAIRVAEATRDLLNGDTNKALKPIVQKLNAEVVITGKADAALLTNEGLGGLVSFRANLTLKALKAQSGEILATAATQASGLDATNPIAAQKALVLAGKNAAKDLASKIAAELERRSGVVVTVQGVKDLNRLEEIKNAFAKTPGVGEIYMRSFSGGTAEIEVRTDKATSLDLANAVLRQRAWNAQVVGQTQDSLEINIP